MSDITRIGANIRAYREKMGLTQRGLADNVLVSFQAISAWERGLSIPDLENAVRLADYFGISVDALLREAGQDLFVGIHGDSTKTAFVLFENDGIVKNVVFQEGANPNDRDLEYSIGVLTRGLEQLLGNHVPAAIFAGLAGASQENYRKAITGRLAERFHTQVNVDWDAANVLSMGADPGNSMAVVCGTGSCVFVRQGNEQYHYGGWGHLFDQAGAAYDVGKDALRCTLAAEDSLAQKNLLTDMVHENLGGKVFDSISTIYKNGQPYIASFAELVLKAAKAGDSCAEQILRDNAKRLAQLISTAVSRHGMPKQIISVGNFLRNDLYRSMVEQQAGVRLLMPDVPAVYGACIEALRSKNLPICDAFHQNFAESYKMLV